MPTKMHRRYPGLAGLILATLLAGCTGLFGSGKYHPVVTAQKSIPRVSVIVSYKADGIYQVEVRNNLSASIRLQWSSSAYVNTGGDTVRLIHIANLNSIPADTSVVQTPSVIKRGEKFKTYFAGESWIDYSRRGVSPRPRDSGSKAKIYLSFNIRDKRVYWTGEVTFVPEK
jgi:hypothetical protein